MSTPQVVEGFIPFREWQTWYRVTGDLSSDKTPLVVAHGGPGCTHDYVLALARLADDGRPVVHYDQLGGGRSTHLPDRGGDFWTVDLFLEELENLLVTLGINDRYFLLGHPGRNARIRARHPPARGTKGTGHQHFPASMDLWASEAKKLRAELPPEVEAALDPRSGGHDLGSGVSGRPAGVLRPARVSRRAQSSRGGEDLCDAGRGPDRLSRDERTQRVLRIGTLRNVVDRVHQITAPTLLASGQLDEATPATVQPFFDGIPNVRWEIFEHSSHMPFVEEPERYLEVVESFLAEYDE